MSTFNGIVKEFPQIQFDFFRKVDGKPPSLANFLSHIHSDHLNGLASKSYRAPFIYCSAATKNLLLKLERRAHRLNYAKKVVESHQYSYLDYVRREKILRVLPLESPTEIELQPGYTIRVTLFEANHCPGSTMFLVEGDDKAILYTGDIRAEPWWLETLKRNPILLPYFHGIKKLDCLYLDTTHASFEASHLRFTPKADGIAELIKQILKYPEDTIFHLNTWTLGYEDAWVAIAAHFKEQIHLDDYRLRLFNTLTDQDVWEHGPFLLGRGLGDSMLTDNPSVRFHSCEKWLECEVRDKAKKRGKLVEISPLVAKYKDKNGVEYMVKEPGEGGANVDANAVAEISGELLLEIAKVARDKDLLELIEKAGVRSKAGFSLSLDAATPVSNMKIDDFVDVLIKNLNAFIAVHQEGQVEEQIYGKSRQLRKLPNWFGYPYSRHSSFFELQQFVEALAPKDVYPCVAAEGSWYQQDSIRKLFGKYCSGDKFAFDIERKLDIDNAKLNHYEMERRRFEELRAAGMESSQQDNSQFLHSPSTPTQDPKPLFIEGDTQLNQNIGPTNPTPNSQFTPSIIDTQPDQTDPDIHLKVANAIKKAKGIADQVRTLDKSKDIRRIEIPKPAPVEAEALSMYFSPKCGKSARITPKRPRREEPEPEKLNQIVTNRRQSKDSAGKREPAWMHTFEVGDSQEDMMKNDNANDETRSGDTTPSTEPDIQVPDSQEKVKKKQKKKNSKDAMDCTQDTYASFDSVGGLDRNHIDSVIRAVDTGNWIQKSKTLGFNNMNWNYREEDKLN